MAKGPKKHLKRINAPKSWLMDKMGGNFAVRPSQGPHALRQSIPIQVFLRDRIKVALNGREANMILHQKQGLVYIDKKVRRDPKYPIGLMDVVEIPEMNGAWRCMYDVKGRFTFVRLAKTETSHKLCRIMKKQMGPNRIAYIVTHDARTIRFADPSISVNDTIRYDIEKGQVEAVLKFETGNTAYVSEGNNKGRVGVITHITKLDGSHDIITLRDKNNHTFTTRVEFVFVIGKGEESSISLPRHAGVAVSVLEEARMRASSE